MMTMMMKKKRIILRKIPNQKEMLAKNHKMYSNSSRNSNNSKS